MKKKSILIIGVLMLIALFFYFSAKNKVSYDPSRTEDIGISGLASFFKMCRRPDIDLLAKYLCNSITDADLYKLEALKTIKGNNLCSSTFENEIDKCSITSYAMNSKEIWKFEYPPALAGKITLYTITIIESDKDHFFIREEYSNTTIQKRDVFILEPLDKEVLEILAS